MPAPGLRPHFNHNTLFHRPSCNQQCARAAAILRHRILSFSIIATLSSVIGLLIARLACAQVTLRASAKGSYTERRDCSARNQSIMYRILLVSNGLFAWNSPPSTTQAAILTET